MNRIPPRRRPGFDHLEQRLALAGSIEGTVFDDLNRDGARQPGEPSLPGRTVFLDANTNGKFDVGERSTATVTDGRYTFAGVPAGNQVVRTVGQPGRTLISPAVPIDGLSTLIPVTTRREVIFDGKRNQLLITTTDGDLYRYDLATRTLLAPIDVGLYLGGGDITEDGKYLYVTESLRGLGQGVVHKVDLDTGAVTDLHYEAADGEGGGLDLKIAANGVAIVTTQYRGSGFTLVRFIDLATDAIREESTHAVGGVGATIRRGADRSLLFFEQGDFSNGPVFTYDARTAAFSPARPTNTYLGDGSQAVNRDGSQMAIIISGQLSLIRPDFSTVKLLGTAYGGAVFDPVRDVLYALNGKMRQIMAYDTRTGAELYRLDAGEATEGLGTFPPTVLALQFAISDDGNTLFLATPSGVRSYALDNPGRGVFLTEGTTVSGLDFAYTAALAPAAPPHSQRRRAGALRGGHRDHARGRVHRDPLKAERSVGHGPLPHEGGHRQPPR